ncbi:MAG: thioredoxin fold domain-containing protein [Pseudomonadota bacterium]
MARIVPHGAATTLPCGATAQHPTIFCTMASPDTPASRMPNALPVPASLQAAAQAARARGEPLVVMVTLAGCAFCDIVRNSHLLPMLRRGEVQAVQIDMLDRRTPLLDWRGQTTTGYELARAWRIGVAPTLLFVDDRGRELAERLEGMGVPDFYGPYLEQRLAHARARLRQAAGQAPGAPPPR